jgi:hypothetical protein
LKEVLSKLNLIIFNQTKTMALIDDLKAQLATLQTSVDAEQAQIQALLDASTVTVEALKAQIAILEEQLASGATPAQIQEVIDALKVIQADIESTVADVPPPPAE